MVKIGILGAMGRMGRAIAAEVIEAEGMELVAVCDRPDHAQIGKLYPGSGASLVSGAAQVFAEADVVIDFTPPGATADHARLAAEHGKGIVVGTTGLSAEDDAALNSAAEKVTVMQAGNYSLGVNLLMALVRSAAEKLGPEWDIDILEMHHRHKVDAPSGTALMLGEAAADGRGSDLSDLRTPAREGITGEREEGTIGFAALRGGSVIGEHEVVFASASERLVLAHKAENRSLFASGAVRAAGWLAAQKPGRYSMKDVLGL
ncbi:4-hydroxy-tetrahydrodipicolinate reductase [Kordiimonas aestuarii]|uniref:4-hydroxy-tetrahydrodipicolinate reductase n=1 Tax=Kordiimonas aestuarii TaxID=1005925 RepID=UPI00374D37A9